MSYKRDDIEHKEIRGAASVVFTSAASTTEVEDAEALRSNSCDYYYSHCYCCYKAAVAAAVAADTTATAAADAATATASLSKIPLYLEPKATASEERHCHFQRSRQR